MIGSLFDDRSDKRKWYQRCEKWQRKCCDTGSKYTVVSCGRGHFFGETYLRKEIFPLREGNFEGRYYFLPRNCDYLLKKLYGTDYMTPVNADEREMHTVIEWSENIES